MMDCGSSWGDVYGDQLVRRIGDVNLVPSELSTTAIALGDDRLVAGECHSRGIFFAELAPADRRIPAGGGSSE